LLDLFFNATQNADFMTHKKFLHTVGLAPFTQQDAHQTNNIIAGKTDI